MEENKKFLEELKEFREEVELSKREKQKRERTKRVLATMKAFIDNEGKITDEQLASTLALMGIATSSSTVGRDLTINLEKTFREENSKKSMEEDRKTVGELTDEQASIIAFIKKKRKDNKQEGLSKGGTISSRRNDIERTIDGKFNGCRKRH